MAEENPAVGLQTIYLDWNPDIGDGPTSSRLTVVDYNGDTNKLFPPVKWDKTSHEYVRPNGEPISPHDDVPESYYFHQVNAWAIVSRVLEDYESSWALGRRVPWGFDGHRLIIVPHAGWGENAYYDRRSKSLQFYHYGSQTEPKYTCLSHDIIALKRGMRS